MATLSISSDNAAAGDSSATGAFSKEPGYAMLVCKKTEEAVLHGYFPGSGCPGRSKWLTS